MVMFDAIEKTVKKIVGNYLESDETIEKFIFQGGFTKRYLINRVLVATDTRLIICRQR